MPTTVDRTTRPADGPPRRLWIGLVAVVVVSASVMVTGEHSRSWHFFADAARGLFDPGLYRAHPELQFGPAVAAISKIFLFLPDGWSAWAVMTAGSVLGVATLWAVTAATGWPQHPMQQTSRVASIGLVFLVPWVRLAAYSAHLDDVLVLAATAGAVLAVTRRRWTWATLLVAFAVAVKPWGVVVAPILVVARPVDGLRRLGLVAGLVTATWLPYLMAPGTIGALSGFGITVDPNSGLRALGLLDATTPGWLRPVQLGLAVVAATVAARRAGPTMVPLAGIAVRLALDPATHHYYTAAFVVAGLLAELSTPECRWPWRTAAGAVILEVAAFDVSLGGFMPAARFAMLAIAVLWSCTRAGEVHAPAGRTAARGIRSASSRSALLQVPGGTVGG